MPTKSTVRKAKQQLRRGKRPTTAAGPFVREEIEHVRRGKHGARSKKQVIAIGLAKARRSGVPLQPPASGRTSARTRRKAASDYAIGQSGRKRKAPSRKRTGAPRNRLAANRSTKRSR